ncbi:MAG: type II toxin-antitoxin system HicB family antitoxin [Anaerolineae bacterium]|jgi:predicted RNase H-like HicB family nuclease|nr:type II toxin-antitoxin system HicB family antitoxin [Anaerolineae bacterium]MDH7475425.1 type II toxin-antitoxin system HicB family antitoxin [Anaerolineae bacterium]
MRKFMLPIIIEKDKDGYFAFCPSLQGCYTQGESYEEVLANIEDAIRLHIEDRLASGESIPTPEMVSLATLEVKA